MSMIRPVLNFWLRKVERRKMERADGHEPLRRNLDLQAKLLCHAPRGTSMEWIRLGGIDALEVRPREIVTDRVVLYAHGGAFVFGSPDTHSALMGQLARRLGARVIMPRYRLAPEHVFPAAIDDIEAAWAGLVATGVPAGNILIGGDSAGAALMFSLLGEICAKGGEMPVGAFGFSPLADLSFTNVSVRENESRDVLLPPGRAKETTDLYLAGHDRNDPRASPVKAGFKGAPPVWLTVGDTEMLRDDAHALAEKISADGGDVTLTQEHDLPHVWPMLHFLLPEARQTLDDLAGWIRRRPGWQDES